MPHKSSRHSRHKTRKTLRRFCCAPCRDSCDCCCIPVGPPLAPTPLPRLTIVKTANPTTFSAIGQVITYSFAVTNNGNVLLNNIVVVDDPLGQIAVIPSLTPGQTVTVTANRTITLADLNAGSVTNTATATASNGTTASSGTVIVSGQQVRSLTLDKVASPTTFSAAGQEITYTYTVTNIGNVTLAGQFEIIDDKQPLNPPIPTIPGPLAPGDSASVQATYTTTQVDVDAGSIINNAFARDVPTGITSNSDTETVFFRSEGPSLTLTNSADPTTFDAVGDVITYTFIVTNTGSVTLTNIAVSDTKLGEIGVISSLAPGEVTAFSRDYDVSQEDLNLGEIRNTATATTSQGASAISNTVTVTAQQNRAITLDKSANESTFSGPDQQIIYTYRIENTGNVTLEGPFQINDDRLTVNDAVGPLPPGGVLLVDRFYITTDADVGADIINNAFVRDVPSNISSNTDGVVVQYQDQAGSLAIVKSANPTTYDAVGDEITYTFTISNTGAITLTNVRVDDTELGDNLETFPSLDSGQTVTFDVTYAITQEDIDAGEIRNTATATADDGTTATSNEVVVTAQSGAATLFLTKTSDVATFSAAGETITYTYTVENVGAVTLAGPITITDDLQPLDPPVPTIDGPLPPNEIASVSATYTTTAADVTAGEVVNSATAEDAGGAISNTDTITVLFLAQTASLAIVKTAQPTTFDAVGDLITYSYQVTNTGDFPLTNITVVDDRLGTIGTIPSLPTGESLILERDYFITDTDFDLGSVRNTATATAAEGATDTSEEVVVEGEFLALALDKSADPTTFTAAGQEITYTYTVTNIGNVTLNGPFQITDNRVIVPSVSGALEPGAFAVVTATYTTTDADVTAGSVENTATAEDLDSGTPSNEAFASVTLAA